jgi:hypothetical protein
VTSLNTSDSFKDDGAKITITNSGLTIRNVKVQCVSNKVIFQDKYTLELNRYALINEYSVPDVTTGESFTADCNLAWTMWIGKADGFFMLGTGTAGKPDVGIEFWFINGRPTLPVNGGAPRLVTTDFIGYSYSQITAIDGSYIILYSWPFSWLQQQKTIHAIARRNNGGIKWRVAPASEPIIADVVRGDGFKITATGGEKEWGIVAGRGTPP